MIADLEVVRVSCQIYPASAVGYGAKVSERTSNNTKTNKGFVLYVSRIKLMQFSEELRYEPISEIR